MLRLKKAILEAIGSIDRGSDFSLIPIVELRIAVELIDAAIAAGVVSEVDFAAKRIYLIEEIDNRN